MLVNRSLMWPIHQVFMHLLGWFMIATSAFQLGGLDPSTAARLALLASLAGVAATYRHRPEYSYRRDLVALAGVLVALLVYWQAGELDDDFWIHSPVQSQLQFSGLPPGHPYFPDLVLRGHYGRDLVISGWANLLGLAPITVQIWLTALVHACVWLLLTDWLRAYELPPLSIRLGGLLFFAGICVGGRVGFLDTFQNNNSFAFAFNFLALLSCQNWLQSGLRIHWVRLALALSYLGVCYEMLWGLVVLTMVSAALFKRQRLAASLLAIGLSAAVTLGCAGSLRQLMAPRQTAPITDLGEASQRQTVSLHFPKSALGKVYMSPQHSSVVSVGFSLLPPLQRKLLELDFSPNRPIWLLSLTYLRQHWVATWLAPGLLLLGIRLRSPALLLSCLYGIYAFWVPGLVDFGPIYERENYRWSYTAGGFFALSLGGAIGQLWPRSSNVGRGLLAGCLALALAPSVGVYGKKILPWLTSNPFPRLRLAVIAREYYLSQPSLNFRPSMFQVTDWLASRVHPGEVIVTDIPANQNGEIVEEACFLTLSGLRSCGHAVPMATDPVGTQPARFQAWHRAFWMAPQAITLSASDAKWLLQTRSHPFDLNEIQGLHQQARFSDSLALYSIEPRVTPPGANPTTCEGQWRELEEGQVVDFGHQAWLDLAIHSTSEVGCRVSFEPKASGGKAEEYLWATTPGQASLPVAAPSQPGRYKVRVQISGGPEFCRRFEVRQP